MSETAETPAGPPRQVSDDDTGRLDGASKGRLFAILAIIVLFSEVVPLQYAMISAAVPKIAPSFPSAGEGISWMIVILGLVGGAISPLIGKLSDLYGKKKMLLVTSVAFLAGTVLCATTSTWSLFLIGRGLQAVAFGMTAIVYGLIRDLMPRKFVPVAIGVSATGLGLSAALAPILAGVLTNHFSWRSLFWFLAIFMVVAIPLLVAFVPESKLRVQQKLDYVGAVVLGAGLAMILLYISQGENWGWGKPTAWGYAVGGVAVLAVWALWEKRVDQPLIDMKLLTAPKVAAVLAIAFLANMIIGVQNYLTSYMSQTPEAGDLKSQITGGIVQQTEAGAKAQGAPDAMIPAIVEGVKHGITFNDGMGYALGFSMLAMALHLAIWQSIGSMISGPVAGAWGQRVGLRTPMIAGMSLLSAGALMYVFLHDNWQLMLICGIVYGLGFGMYYAAAPNLMIEAVPQEQQGIASSMLVVAQSFGASVGVACLSPIFTRNEFEVSVKNPMTQQVTTNVIPQVYTENAYVQGFWLAVVVGLIGLAIAIFMKHGRTKATGGLGHDGATPDTEARETVDA
ncbi:MFS transporter [Yinghuangia seranimata]|uniref:MFS transporter n=1 Tax=Yinghuangia seranimata TaxID=408067 RepID=UPI00248B7D9F|nr:MFS transporter [Yinghuangia seranimata]MDI2125239.1 MFS transporter [Yinghuangia seranimata]